MELTRSIVQRKAEEYRRIEPLYAVEQEQVDSLPRAFETGEFGWRDTEWVVRWYFRRYLGGFDDAERRKVEQQYAENDFDTVRQAFTVVRRMDELSEKLEALTRISGVDLRIASAFLFFFDPSDYVVLDERIWNVLTTTGELQSQYPERPTVDDYDTYLAVCRSLCDRFECRLWTLYRALWRLSS